MVKVVIDDAKGLVQSAGGGAEVNNVLTLNGATTLQGASTVRGDQGYASAAGGTVVTLRCKRETIGMANGTTTTDTAAGFIPANSLVIACGDWTVMRTFSTLLMVVQQLRRMLPQVRQRLAAATRTSLFLTLKRRLPSSF